jgi:hypothetical protein
MNPISYMVTLFYHWFNTRKSSKLIAYESAIWTFVVVLFSNFVALLKLFHYDSFSFDMDKRTEPENYIIIAVGILIGGFIISLFAPKKKIKAINYDLRDESIDFSIMFIYTIGSFVLLIFLY